MNNKNLQPYLWILISGFVFSWMAILTTLAGRGTDWQFVAIARCAIPFVLITAWAKWDGVRLVFFGSRILWIRSIAGSCSLLGTFYLLANVHVTNLQVTDIYAICNIFPIWVALLSWPMLGTFPTGMVWLSIASSIAGVWLMKGMDLNAGNLAVLLVVAVSMFTAVAMLGLNKLKHYDPRAVVVHFSGTGLVMAIAALVFLPAPVPYEVFTTTHLAELIGIGLTASVGQYYLTKAFTAGDPARISIACLSQFVFVLILDVMIVGHVFTWNEVLGMPLILGPTIWLMTRRVKTSALVPDPDAEVVLSDVQSAMPAPALAGESKWAIPASTGVSSDSQ